MHSLNPEIDFSTNDGPVLILIVALINILHNHSLNVNS